MGGARGALLNVHNIQPTQTKAVTGTRDWTKVEVVFETGENDSVQVNCLLGGWGLASGKAWFDDVSLVIDLGTGWAYFSPGPGSDDAWIRLPAADVFEEAEVDPGEWLRATLRGPLRPSVKYLDRAARRMFWPLSEPFPMDSRKGL